VDWPAVTLRITSGQNWRDLPPAIRPFLPPSQALARVQSFGTEVVAGAQHGADWSNLETRHLLIESGTQPVDPGAMGLYGVLVVTTAPVAATSPGCAYPGAAATAR